MGRVVIVAASTELAPRLAAASSEHEPCVASSAREGAERARIDGIVAVVALLMEGELAKELGRNWSVPLVAVCEEQFKASMASLDAETLSAMRTELRLSSLSGLAGRLPDAACAGALGGLASNYELLESSLACGSSNQNILP